MLSAEHRGGLGELSAHSLVDMGQRHFQHMHGGGGRKEKKEKVSTHMGETSGSTWD